MDRPQKCLSELISQLVKHGLQSSGAVKCLPKSPWTPFHHPTLSTAVVETLSAPALLLLDDKCHCEPLNVRLVIVVRLGES